MLDVTPEAMIDAAGTAGFDAVGLRVSAHHAVTDPVALARRASQQGIVLHDTEVIRIGDPDTDTDRILDTTAALGAPWVLVVSDLDDETATLDALGELALRAGPVGVQIALEYMAWTTPRTPQGAVKMATATGCGVVVDVLHHHRIGAGAADLDEVVTQGVLAWVQLADAPATTPTDLVHEARHARRPPGEGELPLGDLLAVVPAAATISIEVQSDVLGRVEPVARARLLAEAARRVLDANG